jgi:hypothetical protein
MLRPAVIRDGGFPLKGYDRMKSSALPLCLALLLGGCISVDHWHKVGTTAQRSDQDFLDCRVRAVNSVPVNTQIRTTPTYTTPGKTKCSTDGKRTKCETTQPQIHGGETYSFDANADLRRDVLALCMRKKGYQLVSLPQCSRDEARLARPNARTTALQENSCVVETTTGRLVVNP